ncbi:MAG: hypothetical protein ACOCXH_15330 [Cyclobacteriaceae bacterium]
MIITYVSSAMKLDWRETLASKHDLLDFLLQHWYNHLDGGRRERTIWDLALIQDVFFPEMAEEVKITTSKEMGNREIRMYKRIDAGKMREEFYQTVLDYVRNLP